MHRTTRMRTGTSNTVVPLRTKPARHSIARSVIANNERQCCLFTKPLAHSQNPRSCSSSCKQNTHDTRETRKRIATAMTVFLMITMRLMMIFWNIVITQAKKDSSYFPAGKSNPNINDKMYWHDSVDVLRDLEKFDKLYVRYHNCA